MLNEFQTIGEGIKDGILSGAGEIIGLGLFTVLIGKYALNNHNSQKEKLNIISEDTKTLINNNESLEDMLKNLGFESSNSKEEKNTEGLVMKNNINWSNVRKLNVEVDGKKVVSTVGGLLSNVWNLLDEKSKMVFLLETLVNASELVISSNKQAKLIVFQKDIDDYLNEKPEHNRSLWGAKKSFLGFDVYFLNQYGYHNASDLIDTVHSLLNKHIKIEITPVFV